LYVERVEKIQDFVIYPELKKVIITNSVLKYLNILKLSKKKSLKEFSSN